MTVRFHFDYLSPYAYLAFQGIHALSARHGHDVELVPILFAAVLNHHGQKGPAEIPAKRSYVFKDCVRTASLLKVPMRPPPSHPFNPLLALRATAAVADPASRRALAKRFFDATWATGEGVTDPALVAAMIDEVGLDSADLLAEATSPDGKERIRANTEQAIADGVFGVPTMIVDGELFWGHDSLPHLEAQLRGEGVDIGAALRRWSGLGSSAQRR